MTGNALDDDYVANLLKQDAKNAAKKYEMVGVDAFLPQRTASGAPKPNKNFLRHLIRQTDNHNAALLAKEADESRARLKRMDHSKERERKRATERSSREGGRLTPPDLSEEDRRYKRKRADHDDYADERGSQRKRKHPDDYKPSKLRQEREKECHRKRKYAREDDADDVSHNHSKPPRGRRGTEQSSKCDTDEDDRNVRRKEDKSARNKRRSYSRSSSRSRSRSRSPARSHGTTRSSKRKQRTNHPRTTSRSPRRTKSKPTHATDDTRRRSPERHSDSDPLEAIVGPLPPPVQPAVRYRGRGARKADSTGMDERFSSAYDPSTDVHLNSDAEDAWGDSLEAFRDRQKWKQQGAERLKAAGFSDEQVKKWAKGDEKNEEDVVWSIKGQAREWDRGKVVDGEGDVELKAEWGRLT
ncbi:hypothetical protein BDV95DRAFT_503264 [Massariosphaeria phaeospora]|uniref:Pre-mRNA-splicing factor 38B n=1 Tax=Massariosphaeria phaeospora TaxID=100035 RepID=A0A7C8M993_9PLEO|nr:hypothetical protein BDV95DRAFT_503264 [Massariosphaeria phaeospora]